MNEQETKDYLEQHFKLYEAEELAAAYQRVIERMSPHLIELAVQATMTKYVKELVEEARHELG